MAKAKKPLSGGAKMKAAGRRRAEPRGLVHLTLTVPQALILRQLALSSDEMNGGHCDAREVRLIHLAMTKLEDGIEAIRGEFQHRATERFNFVTRS